MHRQVRNHGEVPHVACHQPVAQMHRGSTNEQIRKRNHQASLPGFCIDLGDSVTDFTSKRLHGNGSENSFQIAAPLGFLLRRLGAVDAVL
jgi:hypothetical protein